MQQLAFNLNPDPTPKIIPFPTLPTLASPPTIHLSITPTSPSGKFTPYDSDTLCSDGRTKSKKAAPLRSYSDYIRIKNYFLTSSKNSLDGLRNAAILTIGIATGLRISDLVSLQYGNIITTDTSGNPIFRHHITIYEQKTGKRTVSSDDSVLITPAIQQAVSLLLEENKKQKKSLSLDSWLFPSKKPRSTQTIDVENDEGNVTTIEDPLYGQKVITPKYGHYLMKDAQKALNLPINIGSHTLRKTFACLALIIAKKESPNNIATLETVQNLLRQDNVKTTMRYLGITNETSAHIRNEISEFLLGNSNINNISLYD